MSCAPNGTASPVKPTGNVKAGQESTSGVLRYKHRALNDPAFMSTLDRPEPFNRHHRPRKTPYRQAGVDASNRMAELDRIVDYRLFMDIIGYRLALKITIHGPIFSFHQP